MAGLPLYATAVRPEWIDYNGHLRDAFYVLIVSLATDALMDRVGLDAPYRERTRCTLYTLELHVHYLQEVKSTDTVEVLLKILATDNKRIHALLELRAAGQHALAAAAEVLLLHVQQGEVRTASANFPAQVTAALAALQRAGADTRSEAPSSRRIELRRAPLPP